MKSILSALGILLIIIPVSIFGATILWNSVLVEAVTWAKPVTFWQMLGLMVLFYIIFPGTKPKIKSETND